jgi:hypothetical protein
MRIDILQPRRVTIASMLVIAGLLSACSTIRTGAHVDETTNFSSYHSFSWIADDPYIKSDPDVAISPLSQSKIKEAIREQLETRGYTFTDDSANADFVVSYTVGSRDRVRTTSYPVAYRGNWGWHIPGSYYYIHEHDTHTYTEGTLSVDIFDGKAKKPVWHGWAEKTITRQDREDPTTVIRDGVSRLFESFPRATNADTRF